MNETRHSAIPARRPATPVLAVLILLANPVSAQFIKHVDDQGRVTYSQDPTYDYAADEPSPEDQRRNQEQLRQLKAFIKYRSSLPEPEPRAPRVTVRTGRAVCLKRLSVSHLRLGCD